MAPTDASAEFCLVCSGDTRYRSTLDGPFGLVECIACGFQFVLPRPTIEQLNSVYKQMGEAVEPCAQDQCHEAGARLHGLISSFGVSGKDVLEIGCNNGFNLGGLRAYGYAVTGTDLSASAIASAQSSIPDGTFYCAEFPPVSTESSFDVLLAAHVIEHVIDPRSFVRKCAGFLKPGGMLIILTPNVASVGIRLFARHYPVYCPPVHLNYFSRHTLSGLLAKSFEVEHFETNSASTDPRNTIFNSIVSITHLLGVKQRLKESPTFQDTSRPPHDSASGSAQSRPLMPLVRLSTRYAQAVLKPLFWICNQTDMGENILLVARKRSTALGTRTRIEIPGRAIGKAATSGLTG